MANRRLSDDEIALIKGLLAMGMSAQDICGYLFRPNRSLNPAGVYEVKSGQIGPDIPAKSIEDTKAFLVEHPYFGEMATADRVSDLRKELRGMLRLSKNADKSVVDPKETDRLEFKETFHLASLAEYVRSLIAYANNKGGYIVFGVKDNCEIVGLRGNQFQSMDHKKVSENLKDVVLPKIEWHKFQFVFNEYEIGVMYAEESENKPHMTLKNYGSIKANQIYYRYDGETAQIRPGELLSIIGRREKDAVQHAISRLQQIAGLGIHQSEVVGRGDLAEQPKADTVMVEKEVIRKGSLTDGDILNDFVTGELQARPIEYIEQSAHEAVRWLPLRFFMREGGLSDEDVLAALDSSLRAKPGGIAHIRRRLGADAESAQRYIGRGAKKMLARLKGGEIPKNLNRIEARHLSECLMGLDSMEGFTSPFLRAALQQMLDDFQRHKRDTAIGSNMRRSAARVDELLFP